MKILIQKVKGSPCTIDVEPKASADEIKKILIQQHGYPEGTYKFLYNGNILKSAAPFESLKENARVIVYVKEAASKPKPDPKPVQSEPAQPAPTNTSPSHSQPSQQQPSRQQPLNESRRRAEQERRHVQEINALLIECLSSLPVEQVYNEQYDFWDHSDEFARAYAIMIENEASHSVLRHRINRLPLIQQYPGYDRDLPYEIFGSSSIPTSISDIDAEVMEWPEERRKQYDKLAKEGFPKQACVNALKSNDYDYEKARAALQH